MTDPGVCTGRRKFALSNLQQNAARGLAGSSLQGQRIDLELALVAASIGGIGFVVDDSPGCAIGPGEIHTAFDDGTAPALRKSKPVVLGWGDPL